MGHDPGLDIGQSCSSRVCTQSLHFQGVLMAVVRDSLSSLGARVPTGPCFEGELQGVLKAGSLTVLVVLHGKSEGPQVTPWLVLRNAGCV
jgi:hypothetical protein